MTNWKPSDAEVDAAWAAFVETRAWRDREDQAIKADGKPSMERALIAARDAAPEPDTTEFEEAVQAFLVKGLECEDAAQWRDWTSFEYIGAEVYAARQRLIAMYKERR